MLCEAMYAFCTTEALHLVVTVTLRSIIIVKANIFFGIDMEDGYPVPLCDW